MCVKDNKEDQQEAGKQRRKRNNRKRRRRKRTSSSEETARKKTAANAETVPEKPEAETQKACAETRTASEQWLRCPDATLSKKELSVLTKAIGGPEFKGLKSFINDYPITKYYCWAERVARGYKAKWELHNDRSNQHVNRDNITRAAVAAVYEQIRPYSDKPHFGNTHKGKTAILPVLEKVFNMPLDQYTRGTENWFKAVVSSNR